MASRRQQREGADPFVRRDETSLEQVSGELFGDLRQVDQERITRRFASLDEAVIDPAIQVRVGGLDPERVALLKDVLLNGGRFADPVIWTREDEDPSRMWWADGFHRYEARRQVLDDPAVVNGDLQITPLEVLIYPGGYARAVEIAEEANLQHGQPLTLADKRGIYERRWQRGHIWKDTSDRAVAAILGVDHKTVGAWKKVLSSLTVPNSPVRENEGKKEPEKRVGKDGREYRVDRLPKAAQKRAKRGSSHKIYQLIPDGDRPVELPVRNPDESEPAGEWEDRPAQPRGVYQQNQGQGWTAKVSADSVKLSVEIDPDDHELTETERQQLIVAHLRQAAEGLAKFDGFEGEIQQLGDFADLLEREWKLEQ